jgi:hypothetical protein
MSQGVKATRVPDGPVIVRRRVAAMSAGLAGLAGVACGTVGSSPPIQIATPGDGGLDGDARAADGGLDLFPEASAQEATLYDTGVSDVIGHLQDVFVPPCGIPAR